MVRGGTTAKTTRYDIGARWLPDRLLLPPSPELASGSLSTAAVLSNEAQTRMNPLLTSLAVLLIAIFSLPWSKRFLNRATPFPHDLAKSVKSLFALLASSSKQSPSPSLLFFSHVHKTGEERWERWSKAEPPAGFRSLATRRQAGAVRCLSSSTHTIFPAPFPSRNVRQRKKKTQVHCSFLSHTLPRGLLDDSIS